jgi:hypothetical protein
VVEQLDFNVNDALFLVRKALQSGSTPDVLQGLVAQTAGTTGDTAQARAALFARLTVNAPQGNADPVAPAD